MPGHLPTIGYAYHSTDCSGEERDRVMGLTLGADDYITKPFSPRELILRIHNIFRRIMQGNTNYTTKDANQRFWTLGE